MLAIRYADENEKEVLVDLSKSQYEQVTDEDIFEMLGKHGVAKEMRKAINIFQSESEFVDSMSDPLPANTAEIYLQDSFDEFDNDDTNDVYIVIRAEDIAILLQQSVSDCYKAIDKVARVLETNVLDFVEEFDVISCTHILYMVCVALVIKDKYSINNIDLIVYSVRVLFDKYYGCSDRLPDSFPTYWKKLISEVWD